MMLDHTAAGLFPIAPTPFHADGRIDTGSIGTLVDGYKAAGATGVTVLGIMGEAPKLEHDEAVALTKEWIAGMDFVSREEFEAVKAMAAAARDEVEALQAKLAELQRGPS